MKVYSTSNINFGYDKYLNMELKDRLKQNPNSPINNSVLNLNNTCNSIEERIRNLEVKNGGKSENYHQINILFSLLAPMKLQLALIANRLFPEINFCDREADKYIDEFYEKTDEPYVLSDKDVERAYNWKNALAKILLQGKESKNSNIDSPYNLDAFFQDENELEEGVKLLANRNETNPKELLVEFKPNEDTPTSLRDICGLEKTLRKIERNIIEPIECPEIAKQRKEDYGISIPHFLLLYGPPGCGKTMIAQAISQETGCKMYMLDVSRVGSSYVNESAKNIGKIFDYLKLEAQNAKKPILLFMDEIDSLMSQRESAGANSDKEGNKVVNTILTNLNDLKDSNIIVIGATNMYDSLDSAGKNRSIAPSYIGLPNDSDMVQLLKKELSKYKMTKQITQNEDELFELAKKLRGYSPRTVTYILASAKEYALEEERILLKEDIEKAIKSENFEKINEKNYAPNGNQALGFHIE